MHPPGSAIVSSSTRLFSALTLLWLTGNALRLTVLAVPPVIPLIHDDLQLTATQVGILTGLPSMLLAAAAVPGSLLIAKLGVRSALVVGLVVNAMAGAVRGAFPNVLWLYAMTIATAAGVAVMQVTMPSAVRAWLPDRIGFATAVYTNGLLIGEVLPVMLTLPLVLPLVGNWQWGFVVWSAPVLLIAILVQIFAPTRASGASPVRVRWWPDWGNKLIWRLGFMLGTVNAMYFRQRVHPGFSARPRPERMDQRRADRAERWTAARLFRVARLCASVGIESLAYRRLRRDRHGGDADDHLRLGPCDRRRHDISRALLRIHPGAGARPAAAARQAGRRAPRHRGDVHHQLQLRGHRRPRLELHRSISVSFAI
jgi:MFS family permease